MTCREFIASVLSGRFGSRIPSSLGPPYWLEDCPDDQDYCFDWSDIGTLGIKKLDESCFNVSGNP